MSSLVEAVEENRGSRRLKEFCDRATKDIRRLIDRAVVLSEEPFHKFLLSRNKKLERFSLTHEEILKNLLNLKPFVDVQEKLIKNEIDENIVFNMYYTEAQVINFYDPKYFYKNSKDDFISKFKNRDLGRSDAKNYIQEIENGIEELESIVESLKKG